MKSALVAFLLFGLSVSSGFGEELKNSASIFFSESQSFTEFEYSTEDYSNFLKTDRDYVGPSSEASNDPRAKFWNVFYIYRYNLASMIENTCIKGDSTEALESVKELLLNSLNSTRIDENGNEVQTLQIYNNGSSLEIQATEFLSKEIINFEMEICAPKELLLS